MHIISHADRRFSLVLSDTDKVVVIERNIATEVYDTSLCYFEF